MTIYPKSADADAVPSSPKFPAVEERVLAFWKADDTFNASVARNPAGENGANEFVFYDGPPFANGLPHYGHLLTGYVKDIVPRYQTMRGRHVERRFGWDCHGLPAELEAMNQLGLQDQGRHRRAGHREVQRRLPRVGAALHRRVAGLRHPPGPLGRLRARLQDPRHHLHGERAVGVQVPVRQGTGLRGQPGAAVLLERRDPAVQPRAADGRRGLPDPQRPGRHRRPPAGDRRAGPDLDDHAVDAAQQPGDHGRARTSTTWSSSRTSPAAPSATCSPRPGWPRTPASCSAPTWPRTRRPTSVPASSSG